jgi:hypothetical protein
VFWLSANALPLGHCRGGIVDARRREKVSDFRASKALVSIPERLRYGFELALRKHRVASYTGRLRRPEDHWSTVEHRGCHPSDPSSAIQLLGSIAVAMADGYGTV